MFVLAALNAAESVLAVGAAVLFAAAYTALAVRAEYYEKKEARKGRMETLAAVLGVVGSLVVFVGATLDAVSGVSVGSVALDVAVFYVFIILLPVVRDRLVKRNN